jgi:hypothetical protein
VRQITQLERRRCRHTLGSRVAVRQGEGLLAAAFREDRKCFETTRLGKSGAQALQVL